MTAKFEGGKFTYDSYATVDGQNFHYEITLDLNHPEIASMLHKAWRAKGRRSMDASGALVVDTRTAKSGKP